MLPSAAQSGLYLNYCKLSFLCCVFLWMTNNSRVNKAPLCSFQYKVQRWKYKDILTKIATRKVSRCQHRHQMGWNEASKHGKPRKKKNYFKKENIKRDYKYHLMAVCLSAFPELWHWIEQKIFCRISQCHSLFNLWPLRYQITSPFYPIRHVYVQFYYNHRINPWVTAQKCILYGQSDLDLKPLKKYAWGFIEISHSREWDGRIDKYHKYHGGRWWEMF